MPYNNEFRKQVLEVVANLKHPGQFLNKKLHTLEHIQNTYLTHITTKHAMLGTTILDKMHFQVKHIFNNTSNTTQYEVLDFINNVIKWYFKILIKRSNKTTLEAIPISLPDYTIPEIKELYETTLE